MRELYEEARELKKGLTSPEHWPDESEYAYDQFVAYFYR